MRHRGKHIQASAQRLAARVDEGLTHASDNLYRCVRKQDSIVMLKITLLPDRSFEDQGTIFGMNPFDKQ